MYRLTLLFTMLIAFNASAKIEEIPDNSLKTLEELELENIIFENTNDLLTAAYDINSFELIEIEEEIEINFDTKAYLPDGFNPLKGMHDLNWNTIELVELEEEAEIIFNTQAYLPTNFNPLKGMHDLDWDTIELVELEEEVELCFDTKVYLPENFNAYKGMEKEVIACLY
jgi:hypothetical protein